MSLQTSYGLLKLCADQFTTYGQNHTSKVSGWQSEIDALNQGDDEDKTEQIAALEAKIADTQAKATVNFNLATQINNHLARTEDVGFIGFVILDANGAFVSFSTTEPTSIISGGSVERAYRSYPVIPNMALIGLLDQVTEQVDTVGAILPNTNAAATQLVRDLKAALLSQFQVTQLEITDDRINTFLATLPEGDMNSIDMIRDFVATISADDYVAVT